ncbi:hypothetical protein PR002_g26300 [Phytophthora rubi]|uniref:Uncharacterized protein n=2 Tax=Phytophthora rubi TaxID=129364 RepID=A0A6A3HRD5_9STRA|nr:hypothetical protein PR002_g26300 [Phytophthora rubi]
MVSPHYKLCTTETTCSSQTANDTSDHIRVCVEDRDQYFQDEFGASPYLLVDYYTDSSCHEFWMSRVFLADGECHAQGGASGATGPYLGVVTDAEAMTIGVYISYDGCDNLRFYYGILPLSTTNLNSDACVNDKNGYVKYYLVDSSAPLRGCVGELLPHHDWRVYQGREAAAELEDGPYTVELIVHRHDLADGGKGVCEHLNETEAVFYSVAKKHITKSIVVRGNFISKHGMCSLWLKIESQFFRPLTVYRKSMANEMKAKVPWLTIGKFPPSVDLTTPARMGFSAWFSAKNSVVSEVTELVLSGMKELRVEDERKN